jgi:hypothetical protein
MKNACWYSCPARRPLLPPFSIFFSLPYTFSQRYYYQNVFNCRSLGSVTWQTLVRAHRFHHYYHIGKTRAKIQEEIKGAIISKWVIIISLHLSYILEKTYLSKYEKKTIICQLQLFFLSTQITCIFSPVHHVQESDKHTTNKKIMGKNKHEGHIYWFNSWDFATYNWKENKMESRRHVEKGLGPFLRVLGLRHSAK